jgi:predicted metal-dependent HD superfamily phosphohydrolase
MAHTTLETVAAYLEVPGLPNRAVQQRLTGLESRYKEPWRHYHVLEHPLNLFDILLAHEAKLKNPRVVGWTILYHDAIYDPLSAAGRNEELSAKLAENELHPIIGYDETNLVAAYTRATAEHDVAAADSDLDFFLDADLAILGSHAASYDQYAANIRKEYAHVSDEAYRAGRIAILSSLSTRVEETGLFKTPLFKDAYEDLALSNVTREITKLKNIA